MQARNMTMNEVPPLPYTGTESGHMPRSSLIKYSGMPRSAADTGTGTGTGSSTRQSGGAGNNNSDSINEGGGLRQSVTAPAGSTMGMTGTMDYSRRGSDEPHPLQNEKVGIQVDGHRLWQCL
jgi:hypothetical protein